MCVRVAFFLKTFGWSDELCRRASVLTVTEQILSISMYIESLQPDVKDASETLT